MLLHGVTVGGTCIGAGLYVALKSVSFALWEICMYVCMGGLMETPLASVPSSLKECGMAFYREYVCYGIGELYSSRNLYLYFQIQPYRVWQCGFLCKSNN